MYATYQTLLGDKQYLITIYFCSYFAVCVLVMFNLFIAVILEGWDDNDKEIQQEKDLRSVFAWSKEWQKFDPDCTGRIKCSNFLDTIIYAPTPAGFGGKTSMDKPDHLPNSIETFKRLKYLHLVADYGDVDRDETSWKSRLKAML